MGRKGSRLGPEGVPRRPTVAAYLYAPQWGKFESGKLAKGEGQPEAREARAKRAGSNRRAS